MQKSIYTKRLLTDDSYRSCVRCTDAGYVHAGIVGGMTTAELRQYFAQLPFHPEVIVAEVKKLRARWAAAVENADFRRSCARLPRHLEGIPNVEVERQWLAIADELVDRAEVAMEFWQLSGGERALEERINKSAADQNPPDPPAAAPAIELHPVINLKVELGMDEKPLDVRVVALPPRQTTTEIERNGNGDIVGSLQLERDVA